MSSTVQRPSPSAPTDAAIARVVHYFETLSPDTVADLGQFYDAQARFKDPFNDVTGLADIQHIFEHMFVALDAPHFVVTNQVVQGLQCFLTWEFRFAFRNFKQGQPQVILGASHLVLSEHGLVTLHRDYWDAAEELYEKLPLVGSLMRWLKKRANS
jgi:hypothetical protein